MLFRSVSQSRYAVEQVATEKASGDTEQKPAPAEAAETKQDASSEAPATEEKSEEAKSSLTTESSETKSESASEKKPSRYEKAKSRLEKEWEDVRAEKARLKAEREAIEAAKTQREAILGSSNFTLRGLGLAENQNNIELNLIVDSDRDRRDLKNWFYEIWDDANLVEDVKEDIVTGKQIGRAHV